MYNDFCFFCPVVVPLPSCKLVGWQGIGPQRGISINHSGFGGIGWRRSVYYRNLVRMVASEEDMSGL